MKESDIQIRCVSGIYGRGGRTNGYGAQRHDVCRSMTAVIAGRVIFIGIRRVASIADHMVFSGFIDMSIPCPHRPVTDGTEHEPEHEKSSEHVLKLQ